jgi:dipeptidyl aminopeptidase/acylaminoacyl peptidase
MIAFNKDFTRSLYIVSNTGEQKELLRLKGSILSAQFAPQEQKLYCLLSQLQESTQEYREDPYLVEIDLNTKQVTTLLDLKGQGNLMMHLAPDGQYLALSSGDPNMPTNASPTNQLNIIDLNNQKVIATLQGSRPRWLP